MVSPRNEGVFLGNAMKKHFLEALRAEKPAKFPGDFIMCLLHGVTNAHILHLQSKSYAEHKALGSYYDDLGDLVDSVVEQYQGLEARILNYPIEYRPPADTAIAELEYMLEYVRVYRGAMGDDSAVQNSIDEIAALMQSTLYKLRFLK